MSHKYVVYKLYGEQQWNRKRFDIQELQSLDAGQKETEEAIEVIKQLRKDLEQEEESISIAAIDNAYEIERNDDTIVVDVCANQFNSLQTNNMRIVINSTDLEKIE
eukprot:884393_1